MRRGGRQKTDPNKLADFYLYYIEIRKLFVEGRLDKKMEPALREKARALGFCLETGRRFIRSVDQASRSEYRSGSLGSSRAAGSP